MLKKVIKITGIVLGGIFLLGILFYLKVYISTEKRIHKVYNIQPEKVDIPTDAASLALGARLVTTKGCRSCHGPNLAGRILVNDPNKLGLIAAKNITTGKGGLPQDFNYDDWVMALKHGINKDRKSLLLMPSYGFAQLTARDMAAIIAYCSQIAAVDNELPESKLGPLGRVLTDIGELRVLSAERVDHDRPFTQEIAPSLSVAYGKYQAVMCQSCHGENLKGGEPISAGGPPVADISSTGKPGQWTDAQFMATLRSGKTPEGKQLKMPWEMGAAMTDLELKALHLYLKSL
jgi:mono/diheme cytochrome c family protein